MAPPLHAAVDLGAGSGRVLVGGFAEGATLEEAHRFTYPPRESAGHLRWDFDRLLDGIHTGLRRAATIATGEGRPLAIDRGRLVGRRLRAHRPGRTPDRGSDLLSRFADGGHDGPCLRPDGTRSHFSRNGHSVSSVQHHIPARGTRRGRLAGGRGAAVDDPRSLPNALCGSSTGETMNASTTGRLNIRTGDWDDEISNA